MRYSIALFPTVSSALRAEKVLLGANLTVKLIPTPRQLSSDCGVALRFETARRSEVETHLNQARLDLDGIHDLPE